MPWRQPAPVNISVEEVELFLNDHPGSQPQDHRLDAASKRHSRPEGRGSQLGPRRRRREGQHSLPLCSDAGPLAPQLWQSVAKSFGM